MRVYKPQFSKGLTPEKINYYLDLLESFRKNIARLREKKIREGLNKSEVYQLEMYEFDEKRLVRILK